MAVDSKQRKLIPEINEEDFVEYAFSTIKLVIDLAEERDVGKSNGDLETAKLIFQKEHDLRNHLYIKKNSKIDCFKLLEYDVISHRNEEDPGKISYSKNPKDSRSLGEYIGLFQEFPASAPQFPWQNMYKTRL